MMKRSMIWLIVVMLVFSMTPSVSATGTANDEVIEEALKKADLYHVQSEVSKSDLIERIHELFPGQFDELTEDDFRMDRHVYRPTPEEEPERHRISFHKRVSDGQFIDGHFEFVGEALELTNFYYHPGKVADAYYPPEVSRDEAEEIASAFKDEFVEGNYVLSDDEDAYMYHGSNRTLTEPVEYQFTYHLQHEDIPVRGQSVRITVLGNGEVTRFSRPQSDMSQLTFEESEALLTEEEAFDIYDDGLELALRYRADYYTPQDSNQAYLAYDPVHHINGISAVTGQYLSGGEFVTEFPEQEEIMMLVSEPVTTEQQPISPEEAKALVEELLAPADENTELHIEGVREVENHLGQEVYHVNYMYYTGNSGSGSSIEITKQGEIMNFYNHSQSERYYRPGMEREKLEPQITEEEALEKAVSAIEEYAASNMHLYSYPTTTVQHDVYEGAYRYNFPRVHDGVVFSGDSINVTISSQTGDILNFNNRFREHEFTASPEDALDVEEIREAYTEAFDLELTYVNLYNEDDEHYYLVYAPRRDTPYNYFDAQSGQWEETEGSRQRRAEGEAPLVEHAWAAEELNFLIESGIVTWSEDFDADVSMTKGQALEVLMKSLTRFWNSYGPHEDVEPTFSNIDQDHPLFDIVERAAEAGIIDPQASAFDVDANITREELAVWFIRAMRLNEAAEHADIYKLHFSDADNVSDGYQGHVALASAFGILQGNNGAFNPHQEVTLAQMAVATIRLANTITNFEHQRYLY
ncbi:S-layer homology domain-containing protein [Caldalkalibacillus salinus]|uniref:S-layer homology domain-containing protein n=1 Tax=Caldalkalibacillus salinus TaxID=2803787 RepID=UPI0019241AAF|nr:S-layer homology domain-containing protein [Caldalkalibacillus salinus]